MNDQNFRSILWVYDISAEWALGGPTFGSLAPAHQSWAKPVVMFNEILGLWPMQGSGLDAAMMAVCIYYMQSLH